MQVLSILIVAILLSGCASENNAPPPPPPALSVLHIRAGNTITYQEYPASVEGVTNVEIRPQIEGLLQKVYADEGSYVVKGQPLFKIDEAPFRQRLNGAVAQMQAAKGALALAELEVDKMTPLVNNKVVSDFQLKIAKAAHGVAQSNLRQALATVAAARINLGYTLIRAPLNGYLGRLLKKQGSLLSPLDVQPLTVLSDVNMVHVYFALAERDFLRFKVQYAGETLQEKIARMPPISLILPDQSIYPSPGKVDMVDGQFDKATGSVTLRASFSNAGGILRSGNTGKVRLPLKHTNVSVVPQAATLEVQDKVFVFMVGEGNKVSRQPIHIVGKSGADYLVQQGVRAGDRIVMEGLDHLREGQVIQPQPLKSDRVAHTYLQ